MARTVKCPSCGAELTVKEGNRDFMFCEYCGTKVRLDDYQETHRFVDEARIQESKDSKELEMKRMEFEKWKKTEENNDKRTIDNKVKEMKRSVNRSIGKIKRHFDMADPDNIELINNIRTQINE